MEFTDKQYIMGNSEPISLQSIKQDHIIPVHTKDNSALISQSDFVEAVYGELSGFGYQDISIPQVHVSHKIKGRIPEARDKRKEDLLPHEETIYYERMIFLFRVKDVMRQMNGNTLSLVVGGVKAYNWDNLNKDHTGIQHFKVFIGFQVKVCANLCVWSDGSIADIKVNSIDSLIAETKKLIYTYQSDHILNDIAHLKDYVIDETQFAQIVGRCRMYQHLPKQSKDISIDITDSQVNSVVKHYYSDRNFGPSNKAMDLWSLYNLFTHASKSSYIDRFINRNVDASNLVLDIKKDLDGTKDSFFLQ